MKFEGPKMGGPVPDSQVPYKEVMESPSAANETGIHNGDLEEPTEPEPNYEDPAEMGAYVKKLFEQLSRDNHAYGSSYTIKNALTEVCVKAARARDLEDPEGVVDRLKAVDVTSELSNPNGYDQQGNYDGDVLLMGSVIARWGSLEDGYAFSVGDFEASQFSPAYSRFIETLDEQYLLGT